MIAPREPIAPIGDCHEAEPFALQVLDDSMEPEFAKGCIILIDPSGQVIHGAYVFAEYQDAYIFRQLEMDGDRILLRALNEAYPLIPLTAGLHAVKGVIVQRAGTRRRYHKRYD